VFFDPSKVEDVGGFEPIPAGWYRVMVDGVEIKPTKAGNGTICGIKMHVVDGPHGKRILFANFNIQHSSPEAERIGKGQFKRFLKAIGITTPITTAQEAAEKITNKLLYVLVSIGKHYQSGEPTNEVKDYNDQPKAPVVTKAAASTPKDDLADIPF
jgi:hypothetical protein